MSDSETTTDLSDKNCTGEELDSDNLHNLPKVVSQSTGVGGLKRPVHFVDEIDLKRPKHDEVTFTFLPSDHTSEFPLDLVSIHRSNCGYDHHNSGHE